MAELKFKRGDKVTITAPHLSGVKAEVLYDMVDGRFVCVIQDSNHPSGHSQAGALVAFGPDQLESADAPKVNEVSL